MSPPSRRPRSPIAGEWFLAFVVFSAFGFFFFGHALFQRLAGPGWLLLTLAWLFIAVLGAALAVVRHGEHLAALLGEPYGTLILTLSVTVIEVVSISAVMLKGDNNPTLARDTLFAVVMIILNGMVGLSLLIGALRHREQQFNLQGANAYLGVIVPLAVLGLVLPDFTRATAGPNLSAMQQIFLVIVSIGLYLVFLAIQTGRHRDYFIVPVEEAHEHAEVLKGRNRQIAWHTACLLAYLAPALFLAEQLAHPIDYLIETLGAPSAFGGIIIAVLVATPEAIGAVRAAVANQLQRSVNIFLGSILSTLGLTIPAMVLISRITGHDVVLGVQGADLVMLLLTLAVSIVTFSSGRTHIIQGAVHLILFASFLMLAVQA